MAYSWNNWIFMHGIWMKLLITTCWWIWMNIYILLAGKPAVCELGNQQQMDHVQQLCEITKRVAGKSPAWLDDVLMFPPEPEVQKRQRFREGSPPLEYKNPNRDSYQNRGCKASLTEAPLEQSTFRQGKRGWMNQTPAPIPFLFQCPHSWFTAQY